MDKFEQGNKNTFFMKSQMSGKWESEREKGGSEWGNEEKMVWIEKGKCLSST